MGRNQKGPPENFPGPIDMVRFPPGELDRNLSFFKDEKSVGLLAFFEEADSPGYVFFLQKLGNDFQLPIREALEDVDLSKPIDADRLSSAFRQLLLYKLEKFFQGLPSLFKKIPKFLSLGIGNLNSEIRKIIYQDLPQQFRLLFSKFHLNHWYFPFDPHMIPGLGPTQEILI